MAAIAPDPVVRPVPSRPAPVVRRRVAAAAAESVPTVLPEDPLVAVRALLATGDADAAMRLAEEVAEAYPRDPVGHYLAALGAGALGRGDAAEQGYRRALYLDGGFAMAHYLLGQHYLGCGRIADGRRSLANAARAAAGLAANAELAEGEGMTAGELAAAVRHALAVAA